jgi:hypothetical protein
MGPQQGEKQQQRNNQKRDRAGKQMVLFGQEEKAAEESEWVTPEKQWTAQDCPAERERKQPSAYRHGFAGFSPETSAQVACAVQA